MARIARGRIVLWEGGGLWAFDVTSKGDGRTRTDVHAHHAIQITLAVGGKFQIHACDSVFAGPGVAISADVPHSFEPEGSIALLFIEPESAAGRAIASGILRDRSVAILSNEHAVALSQAIREHAEGDNTSEQEWRQLGQELIQTFFDQAEPPPADARIQTTVEWARMNLYRRVGIAEAARHVGLSPDRMSHLFVEQTGVPFRTFLLWLRLQKAVEAYADGASLTAAAYDAGFSDSAHFSRTFKRMFGITAAEFQPT